VGGKKGKAFFLAILTDRKTAKKKTGRKKVTRPTSATLDVKRGEGKKKRKKERRGRIYVQTGPFIIPSETKGSSPQSKKKKGVFLR